MMYKFGDIFEFRKKAKIKAGEGKSKGQFPFYTSSNVLNKFIDEYVFEGESLIFGTGGNVSLHFARDEFAVSTDCLVAQTKNGKINTKYIYYFLVLNNHILEQGFKGAGLKHISKSYISNISIPEVDRVEQDKIVHALDKISALRRKRKEQLLLLDDYLKSFFLEMFGDPVLNNKPWKIVKLEDLITDGPQNGLYKPSSFYGSGVPILRIDCFNKGVLSHIEKLKRIEVTNEELRHYQVYKDNIVINRVNSRSHLGKCCLIPALREKTIFESNMMKFSVDKTKILPLFLSIFLTTPFIKKQILKSAKDAVNQSSINQNDVKNFDIFLPPLDLQNKFAKIVNQTKELKQKMQESLNEMNNYFNSSMQRYFE